MTTDEARRVLAYPPRLRAADAAWTGAGHSEAGRTVVKLAAGGWVLVRQPRPGWERRSRIRRAVLVVALAVLSCTDSPPWPDGTAWRVHGITQTGKHEWTLEVSYWPDWRRVAVMVSDKETALRLEHLMWVEGR